MNTSSPGKWIGLARKTNINTTGRAIDMNKTYWQDNSNDLGYNSKMTAGNTWIRNRETDDSFSYDGYCYNIYNDWQLADDMCSYTDRQALCTVYSMLVLLLLLP